MAVDHFGEHIAATYDENLEAYEETTPAVTLLEDLAAGGPALELGIGTGRIALPLSRAGVPVHGIDLSTAMVNRMKAKPGADRIGVTMGDFATAKAPGTYTLVYLVFNTICNLTTQEEQVACFENVSRHLTPGGRFLVEVGVPSLQRLPPGETVRPFTVEENRLGFDEYDIANQGLISHHFRFDGDRVDRTSIPFRYVWPAELDLMARIAGMRLVSRWSDWHRSPFTSDSRAHVSVWQKIS